MFFRRRLSKTCHKTKTTNHETKQTLPQTKLLQTNTLETMPLQSLITLFTEIKERNRKLERYTEKLQKLFLENSLTKKRNKKKLKKRITAVTALFNEKALETRSALSIDFEAIGNEREREFCKTNWAIESKRMSNVLLRFKDVQEQGVAMERESLELQKSIFSENVSEINPQGVTQGVESQGFNRMTGSKNMKKQIRRSKKRQKNLNEILKNIQILVEILSDMQSMVEANKDVVDAVEVNIEKSEVLSKDGAKNLEDALTYQKRVNAIKRFVYGGFGIVICGILGFSFLFFLPVIIF